VRAKTAGYTGTVYQRNTEIAKELNAIPEVHLENKNVGGRLVLKLIL
jgi:hypothetical protein